MNPLLIKVMTISILITIGYAGYLKYKYAIEKAEVLTIAVTTMNLEIAAAEKQAKINSDIAEKVIEEYEKLSEITYNPVDYESVITTMYKTEQLNR